MTYKFGVDLGGAKISAAVLDGENNAVFHERHATPSGDYKAIIETIRLLIEKARDSVSGVKNSPVGIGIPGALSADNNTVKNANTQVLIGKPLEADLRRALECDIVISNDANCFIASEAADGAAAGGGLVFGVILGTGVGGGVAVNGRSWEGQNRLAGEWGHNSFPFFGAPPKGRQCYCGKTDCIEMILSGPALARDYAAAAGQDLPAAEISRLAAAGDEMAARILSEYADNLAKALSTIINMLDPDIIVLGGGVSNIGLIYQETPKRWRDYVFNASPAPPEITTKLVKNKWGDDSGVRGAAWLTARRWTRAPLQWPQDIRCERR